MKRYTIEFKWSFVFIVVSLLWVWLEKAVGLHEHYIGQYLFHSGLFTLVVIETGILALQYRKTNYYRHLNSDSFYVPLFHSILTMRSPQVQYYSLHQWPGRRNNAFISLH